MATIIEILDRCQTRSFSAAVVYCPCDDGRNIVEHVGFQQTPKLDALLGLGKPGAHPTFDIQVPRPPKPRDPVQFYCNGKRYDGSVSVVMTTEDQRSRGLVSIEILVSS